MNIVARPPEAIATPICPCCGGPLSAQSANVPALVETIALSPIQGRIVECLVKRFGHWVSIESVFAVVWGDDPDGGPISNAFEVHCWWANQRLKPYGLRIEGAGRQKMKRLVWLA